MSRSIGLRFGWSLSIAVLALVSTAAPTWAQNEEHSQEQGPAHQVPETYEICVSTLTKIHEHVEELGGELRFFQMHDPLELLDAILHELPNKLEADVCYPLITAVRAHSAELAVLAEQLDEHADLEESAQFAELVDWLPPIVSRLGQLRTLSNESLVELPANTHNVPNTFGRCLNRLTGLTNALLELSENGRLYQAHEITELLDALAEHLPKIAEQNLVAPIRQRAGTIISSLQTVSQRLHDAADVDDPAPLEPALAEMGRKTQDLQTLRHQVLSALSSNENQSPPLDQLSTTQLLSLAGRHQSRLQLTRPAGANAYEVYLRVLQMDPDNDAAREGLNQIVEWFVHHAQEHEEKGEMAKATIYFRRALDVDPDSESAHEGLERVQEPR